MIVKWDKPRAGVKVIPAQDENNTILGHITLLPGYNEVNDALWEAARKNISRDPEAKFIKEESKIVKSKELPKGGVESSYKKEKVKEEKIPDLTFDKAVMFLQDSNLYEKAIAKAKEDKVIFDEEFLMSLLSNSNEEIINGYNEFVGLKPGDEYYLIPQSLTLDELTAQKALVIVNDTWNMETLESWRKVESRDEIRAAIANQIEEVGRPPILNA